MQNNSNDHVIKTISDRFPDVPSTQKLSTVDQLYVASCARQLQVDEMRLWLAKLGFAWAMTVGTDDVLGIMHYMRLQLITTTPRERAESENWLRANNRWVGGNGIVPC